MSAALTVPAIARASVAIKSRLVVFENFSVFMVLKPNDPTIQYINGCIFAMFRAWILTVFRHRRSEQTTTERRHRPVSPTRRASRPRRQHRFRERGFDQRGVRLRADER